jgi:hypothetical protein
VSALTLGRIQANGNFAAHSVPTGDSERPRFQSIRPKMDIPSQDQAMITIA